MVEVIARHGVEREVEVEEPEQRPGVSRTLLSVEDLVVRFTTRGGEVRAVDGVSLELREGERVALIGESGSGKSATCLAIAGFLTGATVSVSASRLDFDGQALLGRKRPRIPVSTPGLTMVFQDAMTSLDPVWSVGSQLAAVLTRRERLKRPQVRALAEQWLKRVGLHDTERVLRARPYELSGGMRQRVMLALAMCGEPRLLIADEPTSALDASLAREAMELMLELTEELGTTLLVVSHDIKLSQEYCDRSLVMYGGRIVEELDAGRLAEDACHPYTIGLLRCVPTLESAGLDELPTIGDFLGTDEPQRSAAAAQACA